MHNNTLLLETIKIEDGEIFNLAYHQKRFDKSRQEVFKMDTSIALSSIIQAPKIGLYRCRIIYGVDIHSVEYIPYIEKKIDSLKIVTSSLDYSYKYAQRETLDILCKQQLDYDDIIIEKNGLLTDTSIANIAFYQDNQWFTPASPLLKGTMRQRLLDENYLKTTDISIHDLKNYSQVALMNAMIGFKILNNIKLIDTKGIQYDY